MHFGSTSFISSRRPRCVHTQAPPRVPGDPFRESNAVREASPPGCHCGKQCSRLGQISSPLVRMAFISVKIFMSRLISLIRSRRLLFSFGKRGYLFGLLAARSLMGNVNVPPVQVIVDPIPFKTTGQVTLRRRSSEDRFCWKKSLIV